MYVFGKLLEAAAIIFFNFLIFLPLFLVALLVLLFYGLDFDGFVVFFLVGAVVGRIAGVSAGRLVGAIAGRLSAD